MNVAKLLWSALVLLVVAIPLVLGCSRSETPPAGEILPEGTRFIRDTGTAPRSIESEPYSTRELALKESGSPTALWEGKIIYNALTEAGNAQVRRIVEHDLATGQETPLIDAQPPHTDAVSLHRSGDWLFYVEEGTTETGPTTFDPPRDYYAFNLRTGQRRHLMKLQGPSCIGFQSGPNYSGSAFGDNGFAYIKPSQSSGECRDHLRVYNAETGEDRLLVETESADTVLDSPMLRGDKVLFNQGWRSEWPPDFTPTPIPGRPGPWPPRYQLIGDIFSLDLKTGERINLSNTGRASQPALWGDYLMWIDQPVRATQEHGSGEVFILNTRTGQLKKLTDDATYMHLYSSPQAGDGFFVWGDAHPGKDKLPVYLPESEEMVYLEGPGGRARIGRSRPDGKTLFWSWTEETTPENATTNDRRQKVYMTTFR